MEKIIKKFGELAEVKSYEAGYEITYHGHIFTLTKDHNGIIFNKMYEGERFNFPEVSLYIDDVQIYRDSISCMKNNDVICVFWV